MKRLDALNGEVGIQAALLLALPMGIYAVHLSYLYFGRRPFNPTETITAVGIATVCMGYVLFRLVACLNERRRIRLGCEGEMVVGQALNRLMLEGWRVYHDFPADGFHIDHIVVGAKGVFAVETNTRSMRTRAGRQQDATVEYDGRALHFPDGTDIDMIARAKRRSKWLADWLSRAVGEAMTVRAVLALPGWYVKRTAAQGMPVVNPHQFESLFQHIQPRSLTPGTITRIADQLEQKCREGDPKV